MFHILSDEVQAHDLVRWVDQQQSENLRPLFMEHARESTLALEIPLVDPGDRNIYPVLKDNGSKREVSSLICKLIDRYLSHGCKNRIESDHLFPSCDIGRTGLDTLYKARPRHLATEDILIHSQPFK